jgi:hypothetical protein
MVHEGPVEGGLRASGSASDVVGTHAISGGTQALGSYWRGRRLFASPTPIDARSTSRHTRIGLCVLPRSLDTSRATNTPLAEDGEHDHRYDGDPAHLHDHFTARRCARRGGHAGSGTNSRAHGRFRRHRDCLLPRRSPCRPADGCQIWTRGRSGPFRST